MKNLWREVKLSLLKYIRMGKFYKELINLGVTLNMNPFIYK